MNTHSLTVFGMAGGRPAFRHTIDSRLTSPQGLECCRTMIGRLAEGAESAEVPFPLVPDSTQRLAWGVPFLDELDDVSRRAFERVMHGWPGHLFTLLEVNPPENPRLATGLVVPDDESAEAHDAFGELAQIMLLAALAQRAHQPLERDSSDVEPFTSHDLIASKPALLLDVQSVPSQEFAGRLVSFAGHYSLVLLGEAPEAK